MPGTTAQLSFPSVGALLCMLLHSVQWPVIFKLFLHKIVSTLETFILLSYLLKGGQQTGTALGSSCCCTWHNHVYLSCVGSLTSNWRLWKPVSKIWKCVFCATWWCNRVHNPRKIWQGWTVTNSLNSANSWLKMAAFSLALTARLTAPRLEEPFAAFFGESEMLKYDWVQGRGQSQMSLHWLANSCSQGAHWTFWLSN